MVLEKYRKQTWPDLWADCQHLTEHYKRMIKIPAWAFQPAIHTGLGDIFVAEQTECQINQP